MKNESRLFKQNVLLDNCIKSSRKSHYKYDSFKDKQNRYKINDIIYDNQKHLVSEFKDYLLWDETSDFLRR